jgi:hypothetical protein
MSSEEIADTMRSAAKVSIIRMRTKMEATWDQGSHRLSNSLAMQVSSDGEGNATLEFTLAEFKELQFVSRIGGQYRPGPYRILPSNASRLVFFWKRIGRRVALKKVTHPGFPYDVIVDSAQQEVDYLADAAYNRFYASYAEAFGV